MKSNTKLKPATWCALTDIIICDPDGWDRTNFDTDWAKPLTFDEFLEKAHMSTTMASPRMTDAELKCLAFAKMVILNVKE
jgi:hypothetical protein